MSSGPPYLSRRRVQLVELHAGEAELLIGHRSLEGVHGVVDSSRDTPRETRRLVSRATLGTSSFFLPLAPLPPQSILGGVLNVCRVKEFLNIKGWDHPGDRCIWAKMYILGVNLSDTSATHFFGCEVLVLVRTVFRAAVWPEVLNMHRGV